MCGIVGGIMKKDDVVDFLTDGLERLEYRGYDSSGIAVIDNKEFKRVRRVGRVENMKKAVESEQVKGFTGIGHTRWPTHGGVTEINAHPHIADNLIAVVHNGIIENYEEERKRLTKLGCKFESETDTEIIAHAICEEYKGSGILFDAVINACARFRGSYAIGVMASDKSDELVAVRMGCPLLIGLGDDDVFIASDAAALVASTNKVIFLQDGDAAFMKNGKLQKIVSHEGVMIERKVHFSSVSADPFDLGEFSHYMQKEIYEQPEVVDKTAIDFIQNRFSANIFGDNAESIFKSVSNVKILACGTSFHAGLIAMNWIEKISKIPCSVETSGEFRYRDSFVSPNTLVITISQSGETLDTMEALKHSVKLGSEYSLSICNVRESSLPRESSLVFYTKAGIEIGVASTKAFTTQLIALFGFAVSLGLVKGVVSDDQCEYFLTELKNLSKSVRFALNSESEIKVVSRNICSSQSMLYLGRGVEYPIALEGALKLKEISYIHAEGYPAGELKHGPLALVDENVPVCVLAPTDNLFEKIKSNMQEVIARKGNLIVFTDSVSDLKSADCMTIIKIENSCTVLTPIVFAIPIQLLAYHTALQKGTDVDKPRNLAKSVTVE